MNVFIWNLSRMNCTLHTLSCRRSKLVRFRKRFLCIIFRTGSFESSNTRHNRRHLKARKARKKALRAELRNRYEEMENSSAQESHALSRDVEEPESPFLHRLTADARGDESSSNAELGTTGRLQVSSIVHLITFDNGRGRKRCE